MHDKLAVAEWSTAIRNRQSKRKEFAMQWTKMIWKCGLCLALLICCGVGAQETPRSGDAVRDAQGERKVRMDVVICLDSTGSMDDEIDVVKAKLKRMVTQIADGQPKPEVRFGIVTYRDRGDAYVTRKFPLSEDIAKIKNDIDSISAGGGGDGPESVNEALHVAVEEMNWDTTSGVSRLIFLIGDAPPHYYADDYNYQDEIVAAITRRIVIHTIGCSGLDEYGSAESETSATSIWQEIALRTEGRFDYIAYFQDAVDGKGEKVGLVAEGSTQYLLPATVKNRWREGARRLTAEGRARVVDASMRLSVTSGKMENNLDALMTRSVQVAAQKRGVFYKAITARQVRGATLARGVTSGLTHGEKIIITSQAAWQALWRKHSGAFVPAPALPKVDFTRQAVIVVALGEKTATGRAVQIMSVEEHSDATVVRFKTTLPRAVDKSKKILTAATQPYHIIVVPRPQHPVKFAAETD